MLHVETEVYIVPWAAVKLAALCKGSKEKVLQITLYDGISTKQISRKLVPNKISRIALAKRSIAVNNK